MEENTAFAKVDTTTNPKSLLVKNEDWDRLLSQFSNLEKVKITITKIDEQ